VHGQRLCGLNRRHFATSICGDQIDLWLAVDVVISAVHNINATSSFQPPWHLFKALFLERVVYGGLALNKT
jgi:hypothetical protein